MNSSSTELELGTAYLKTITDRINDLKASAEKAMAQVSDHDLNWALNEDSNSIAILVKHLSGNMISRWTDFLTTDGEKESRDRDGEFEGTVASKEELLEIWNRGWDVFADAIASLHSEDLLKTVYIKKVPQLVIEAIEKQVSHYSSHIGQIIYVAKQIKSDEWSTLSIPRKK